MDIKPVEILYVDDEVNNLEGFKALFRRDFNIEIFNSAKKALEYLVQKGSPPIIISDQRMPEMTGSEFLKEVALTYPESVRILITAYSDLEATINAINEGKIYYYIEKPFNPDEVKTILNKAFEFYSLKSENNELTVANQGLALKMEREEKELIKAQLQNLRSHINPHFLFNSLNTLSALINENEKARRYVRNLSHVYRYILENSDQNMASLKEEIDFIKEYLILIEIRFNNGLIYNINIEPKYFEYLLPSFSLQIVIENIFKHNAVSEDFPLTINVNIFNNNLVIENNINPKKNLFPPSGTGLRNLIERYSLLTSTEPEFNNDGKKYQALLPLINPKQIRHDQRIDP